MENSELINKINELDEMFNDRTHELSEKEKRDILNELERELFKKKLIKDSLNRNVLKESDVIGFDIDHTIGLYNLTTLAELLYNSFSRYLIEFKNYPNILNIFNERQESENLLSGKFDFLKKELFYELSGVEILVDLHFGNCMKISQEGLILKAFHGIKELDKSQIKIIYGENCKIPKEYNYNYEINKTNDYIYLQGYFEYHIPSLYLFCVELYEIGEMKLDNVHIEGVKPYKRIIQDIFDALIFNYAITDKKFEETGYFFSEISKNPKKYLCPNLAKDTLLKIKALGLNIFYATNSYKEFGDFILKNTLGENFLDLFDLGISFSKKPIFFNRFENLNEVNFNFPDCSFQKFKEKESITLEDLIANEDLFEEIKNKKAIIGSSFELVKIFYRKLLNKDELNYIYVGDSIVNDCIAPVKNKNIKSIVVIEFIDSFYHGIKPDNLGERWNLDLEKDVLQVHIQKARINAEFSISNVQSLKLFC